MLSNYFWMAWRNAKKHKSYSILNILGLAVAIAAAILMSVWIWDEYNCDNGQVNRDRIYEVYNKYDRKTSVDCWNVTPKPMAKALEHEAPEIEQTVRVYWPNEALFTIGNRKMKAIVSIADSNFFDVFTFPLVAGSKESILKNANAVVITESLAKKLFGSIDVLDKAVHIDKVPYTVSGIMKDYADKSRFQFDCLMSYAVMKKKGFDDDYWSNNSIMTYAMLGTNAKLDVAQSKIKNIRKKYDKDGSDIETFLYPISRARLYGRFENGNESGGRITIVKMLSIISILILIIACINFMNLSTASSQYRAREVGVRKVAGATKKSLIAQFLTESVLMAMIALILSLLLVKISFPYFNELAGKELSFVTYLWPILGASFAFALFSGLLAGSYPSWYLSSFDPVQTLKGVKTSNNATITPRRLLILFQFFCSSALIITTTTVNQQLKHVQSRDSGYNKEQLVYHTIDGEMEKNYLLIKNELLQSGLASSVTKTSAPITEGWSNTDGMSWPGKDENNHTIVDRFCADDKVVQTLGLKLIAGRDLDLTTYTTDSSAMIINASMARLIGFKDPTKAIGQSLKDNGISWTVVGVMEDFILHSPFSTTKPLAIEGAHGWFNIIHVKYTAQRPINETLSAAERIFSKYNPTYPFNYKFVDEEYGKKFSDAKRIASISTFSAGLSIFISCLGLFGLVSFMAATRKKELAIRKVNGASVHQVVVLITKDFIKIIGLAFAIAAPITFYYLSKWLDSYSYKIDISWTVFAITALILLIITLITIGFQAIKAALANPIHSLKSE